MGPRGPIFYMVLFCMDSLWVKIVQEALSAGVESSNGPVPGAKLRQLVVKVAKKHGLTFPPAGFEGETFGAFIKHFEDIALVRRREGRDLLVAPADNPQLLVDSAESEPARLREDIFEAFTQIPRGNPPSEPWYSRADDTIKWLSLTQLSGSGELVKIPAATLGVELSDRKSFIQSMDLNEQDRNRIAESLDARSGLGSFSKLLKLHGLSHQWHRYRFQAIVRRIRAWCITEGVPWHEEWIQSSANRIPTASVVVDSSSLSQRQVFERISHSIADEDLRRILVPLDIVLKLIR